MDELWKRDDNCFRTSCFPKSFDSAQFNLWAGCPSTFTLGQARGGPPWTIGEDNAVNANRLCLKLCPLQTAIVPH
jgi:hypothetical protein